MNRGKVSSTQSRAIYSFAHAPQVTTPRSKFDMSHGIKTTFDEGYLVPILVEEMLPGDTFRMELHGFARMATSIYPIMDNLYMESFAFFVPNRLVWSNWTAFMGEVDPNQSAPTTVPNWAAYSIPQLVAPVSVGIAVNDVADYFGLPTGIASISFNALPFRALNKIFNDWFRDENLMVSSVVQMDNGPDTYTNYPLLQRCKRYDYFTACLPWPQKGPAVTLPLGATAPVYAQNLNEDDVAVIRDTGTNAGLAGALSGEVSTGYLSVSGTGYGYYDPTDPTSGRSHLYTDLTDATASTVNDLREAFQMQKFYERAARGGTRYTEMIKSFFGVTSPDMRLARSEYIGGGSTPIVVNPVAQTAQATSPTNTNVLGNLGAFAVCNLRGHRATYSATEHGYIIWLINVRADINYQQGMNRLWSRQTIWDFYQPPLAHLGEQAVLNKEIYCQGNSSDNLVFGYQERYAEYRYHPGLVTSLFRSQAAGTLDAWHLAFKFTGLPALNKTFIVENAPMDRIEAVSSQPDFIFDGHFSFHAVRPMPTYAVPGYIDHF